MNSFNTSTKDYGPSKIIYHHRIASADGQLVHLNAILEQFKKQGHDVTLVGPKIHPEVPKDQQGKQSLVSKLKQKMPKALYEIIELSYSAIVAFRLYKEIKRQKPQFIYERYNALQPAGVWLAKKMDIPILLEVNAPLVEERSRFGGMALTTLAKKIENWTWKNADIVLPVTNVLANHVRAAGVDDQKIVVLHNGVHKEWSESLVLKPFPARQDQDIVIGFVGFMHLTGGVEWALECLPELPSNVRLVCVGDPPMELKRKAEELSVMHRVTFTGLLSKDAALEQVSTFDIALQPDVTAYASPLKMFEYMACRTLIIAPSSNNIKEILDEHCAVFFELGDKESFKKALIHAGLNIVSMRAIRENARSQLDKKSFYWDDNALSINILGRQLDESQSFLRYLNNSNK